MKTLATSGMMHEVMHNIVLLYMYVQVRYLLSDLDTEVLLNACNQWLLAGGVEHPLLNGRLEARARVNEYCT